MRENYILISRTYCYVKFSFGQLKNHNFFFGQVALGHNRVDEKHLLLVVLLLLHLQPLHILVQHLLLGFRLLPQNLFLLRLLHSSAVQQTTGTMRVQVDRCNIFSI